jgi:hypothetical protein
MDFKEQSPDRQCVGRNSLLLGLCHKWPYDCRTAGTAPRSVNDAKAVISQRVRRGRVGMRHQVPKDYRCTAWKQL